MPLTEEERAILICDEKSILAEMRNIVRNAPLWPGDTISHRTATECEKRGWARRNEKSEWVPIQGAPFTVIKS